MGRPLPEVGPWVFLNTFLCVIFWPDYSPAEKPEKDNTHTHAIGWIVWNSISRGTKCCPVQRLDLMVGGSPTVR